MTAATGNAQRVGSRSSRLLLAGLIAASVTLGGAIFESPMTDLILQPLACMVLCWCIVSRSQSELSAPGVWLVGFLVFLLANILLQLAPLPMPIWSSLPGRAEHAEALRLVGVNGTALPLSLAPQETLEALFWMLPPVAVFALTLHLDFKSAAVSARWTVPAIAAASAALGLAQVVAAGEVSLYFHEGPAKGHAAGFFEVVNYQPILLLIAIPFVAVLFARLGARFEAGDAFLGQAFFLATLLFVLVVGVAAAGSLAGYVLVVPVILASLPIALQKGMRPAVFVGILIVVVGVAAVAIYAAGSPLLAGVGSTSFGSGSTSRIGSWVRTVAMAADHFPVGVGLGAFRDAYGAYEDGAAVTNSFVAHAHNDYLEIVAELGLPGLLLIAGLVGWWAVMTFVIWRLPTQQGLRTKKAASIAVAVVVLHSLIDSPARTEAIACLAALCLGLMAASPIKRGARRAPITEHRHIEL